MGSRRMSASKLALVMGVFALGACQGSQGPVGPAGKDGTNGANGATGAAGAAGASCTVAATTGTTCGDAGGFDVTCGTTVKTICNGATGNGCTIAGNTTNACGTGVAGFDVTCGGSTQVVCNGATGVNGSSTGTVAVTVTDSTSAQLVGATLATVPATATATTVAAGTASLTLPIGTYTVKVSKSGLSTFSQANVVVNSGATVNLTGSLGPGVPFALIRVVGVSGNDGDTDERVVPGASGNLTIVPDATNGATVTTDGGFGSVKPGDALFLNATTANATVNSIVRTVTSSTSITVASTALVAEAGTVPYAALPDPAVASWRLGRTRLTKGNGATASAYDAKIVTNGQRNVAIGTYVYLVGADTTDTAWNAGTTGDITGWSWTLSPANGGVNNLEFSATGVTNGGAVAGTTPRAWSSTPQTRWARFMPTVPGEYVVDLTATVTGGAARTDRIVIYAGTFVGEAQCAGCHSNPDVVGETKAVYADFLLTGHATKFENTYSMYSASSDYCTGCHTTAFDQAAGNGAFDDRLRLAGWDPVQSSAIYWMKASGRYPTIADFLSDPNTLDAQQLMNIQCEECHGPGSNHPDAASHMSLGDDACKQCHSAQPPQWEMSAHAKAPAEFSQAGSPDCARCHTGQGFVVGQDHGQTLVFPNDATDATPANMFEPGNAQPIGCGACHDPHKFTNGYYVDTSVTPNVERECTDGIWIDNSGVSHQCKSDQLRFEGAITTTNGYVFNAGKAGDCAKCHNSRRDQTYRTQFMSGLQTRAFHDNPQVDMLTGHMTSVAVGYEYPGKTYGNSPHRTQAKDACVTCHMSSAASGAACSGSNPCADPGETCVVSHGVGSCAAQNYGGHTYEMAWTDQGGNEHQHTQVCNTCHGAGAITDFNVDPSVVGHDDLDCDANTTGVQDDISGLLTQLANCLVAANSNLTMTNGELNINGKVAGGTTQQRQAMWNYSFVLNDGSSGIHNTTYAAELLWDSLADMGCPVTPANGFPAANCGRP